MSGISCLCGYNLDRPSHKKAFVLMANSFSPPTKDLFEIIDNFISNQVAEK